jgi:hypothetical protein
VLNFIELLIACFYHESHLPRREFLRFESLCGGCASGFAGAAIVNARLATKHRS